MRACGLYRLWRPRAFGGLEVDPMTAFRVLEEVSRIDSAAGWNLQLSSAIDAMGAWFPDEGAKEIYGQPGASFGGWFFPSRRAVAADGGYHVTGQTPFVSGAHQAHWFLGLAQVYDGDTPRLGADGAPVTLLTMCPASDAFIVDNWRTLGMRGTGSHDVVMSNVFVPSRHTALLAPYEKPGSAYDGPLYKFTVWTAISVLAPPPLGSTGRYRRSVGARRAKDAVLSGNAAERPHHRSGGNRRGGSHARRWAGLFVRGAGGSLGQGARRRPDRHAGQDEAAARATYAIAAAVRTVDLVHKAVGTTGIRDEHRFQRYFRDVHTIEHHAYISAARYESGGQYFLRVPIEWPFYGL